MKSAFCKIQWVSVVIAALVFVGCEDVRLESEDTIKKSFQVGPGGRLTLETDRGSIEVKTVDSNTLEVEVNRKVYALDREKADEILKDFDIEFTQRGNDLHIRGEFKRPRPSFWGWRRQRLRLHYLVSVPKKYNVDLKTAGGSISIDDLEGEVRSKTSGGSLRFGHIQGPVWGRTSGGSIRLADCIGRADIKTSGGSISIGEVDGDIVVHTSGGSIRIDRATGSVMAKTSGGSITVEEVMGEIEARTSGGSVVARITRQPQKNCLLRTSGGNVVVYLADNIAVDVDAETSGGYIKTELPITVQGKVGKTKLQGKMNGGGPELFLRTSGGNIHLRKK
jgi:DUF4097 and DUF4098 domain-containing protein YvlB